MWRWLAVFLFGGVLGTGFGVALGFFLFPYVFPPPEAKTTEVGKEWLSPGELYLATTRENRSVGKQLQLLTQLEKLESAKTDPAAFKLSCDGTMSKHAG